MPDNDDIPAPATGVGPTRIAPATSVSGTAVSKKRASGGRRGWVVASTIAVAGVVAAIGVTGFVVVRGGDATENRVRDTVEEFVDALGSGDLPALQASTCGALADFYRDVPPTEFAGVHHDAVTHGSVPVVTSIDTVQVTEDTARIQVTAYTRADAVASPRTFDLQRVDGSWKVCDPA
ncbi:hypothetical protein [Prescottella subtropica]|uniref:Rv0361 family membrane protein n=1 Tax=Prescottella subtropica TaxID=2545757 RepID=UPI0018833B54|nr:hypothetical protein [Prescottella subtropica]